VLMPGTWFYDTLEQCCERYYPGWNKNVCMGSEGSGLWYVNYAEGKCMTDCEARNGDMCGGVADLSPDELFLSPKTCCAEKLPWVFNKLCESKSFLSSCYQGTGRFYRGDPAGVEVCVKDCIPEDNGDPSCGGLLEDQYLTLYDAAEDCCSTEYSWMNTKLCVSRVEKNTTVEYWPDKIEGRCFLDSENPAEDLGVVTFNSIEECCSTTITWKTEAKCVSSSGGGSTSGTGKFFVSWLVGDHGRCVQDCEGTPPCLKLAESHDVLYDTASACCNMLGWVAPKECVYSE